jgi:hypothetical protein
MISLVPRRPVWPAALVAGALAVAAAVWPAAWPVALRVPLLFTLSFIEVALTLGLPPSGFAVSRASGRTPTVLEVNMGSGGFTGEVLAGASGAALEPARPRPEIRDTLPASTTFRGRQSEVTDLARRLRPVTERPPTGVPSPRGVRTGHRIVVIHGMPGIGKTELAIRVAQSVAAEYPDGVLYADLHNADRASVNDVLARFLDAIAPGEAIPPRETDRGVRFREITEDRRMLFVIDAARDHSLVDNLLPGGRGCGVIVTSRRDLGRRLGAYSLQLGLPDRDDAIDMLYAIALLDSGKEPDSAAEIIEACGRLPLAIRLAGERISKEGTAIGDLRTGLRNEETRLERLRRPGTGVDDGFADEYRHLNGNEQLALCLLSQITAPIFLPWVLRPLMGISHEAAVDLCNRLSQVQLIELIERDDLASEIRYRMHPLIRLFADERIRAEARNKDIGACFERLDEAYAEVVDQLAAHGDHGYTATQPLVHLPQEAGRRVGIVLYVNDWLGVEYTNLARGMRFLYRTGNRAACWRMGVILGGVVPAGRPIDIERGVAVLDRAIEAADDDGMHPLAAIDARIGKATTMIALENYREAREQLNAAADRAERLEAGGGGAGPTMPEIRLRQAWIHRRWGAAFVQVRRPSDAERELGDARRILRQLDATLDSGLGGEIDIGAESGLVEVFDSISLRFNMYTDREELEQEVGQANRFWVVIADHEQERRRRNWATAHLMLDDAERLCFGDSRRRANVLYRRTRLYLVQYDATCSDDPPDGDLDALVTKAIRASYEAILTFQVMGNKAGVVRTLHLAIRALARLRPMWSFANSEVLRANRLCDEIADTAREAIEPLRARIHRAHGELLLRRGLTVEARAEFERAVEVFRAVDDHSSIEEVDKLLRAVEDGEDGQRNL